MCVSIVKKEHNFCLYFNVLLAIVLDAKFKNIWSTWNVHKIAYINVWIKRKYKTWYHYDKRWTAIYIYLQNCGYYPLIKKKHFYKMLEGAYHIKFRTRSMKSSKKKPFIISANDSSFGRLLADGLLFVFYFT